MSHIHPHDEGGGVASGMILGIVVALLVAVVLFMFVFGGFGLMDRDGGGAGIGTEGSDNPGAGNGDSPPASMQYIVPDYQLAVR
ncbi:MAG: hypothetical protein WD058_08145 [Dehalococcoidia bacterium]